MATPSTPEANTVTPADRHAIAGKLVDTWLSHESLAKWIGSGLKPEDAEVIGHRIGAMYAGILKGMTVETRETPRERVAKQKGILEDSA